MKGFPFEINLNQTKKKHAVQWSHLKAAFLTGLPPPSLALWTWVQPRGPWTKSSFQEKGLKKCSDEQAVSWSILCARKYYIRTLEAFYIMSKAKNNHLDTQQVTTFLLTLFRSLFRCPASITWTETTEVLKCCLHDRLISRLDRWWLDCRRAAVSPKSFVCMQRYPEVAFLAPTASCPTFMVPHWAVLPWICLTSLLLAGTFEPF